MRASSRRIATILFVPVATTAVALSTLPAAAAPGGPAGQDRAAGQQAAGRGPTAQPERPGRAPADANGRYVVLFRPGADPQATTAKLRRDRGVRPTKTYSAAVRGLAAPLDTQQVDALRRDPDVALVAPDLPVRATAETPTVAGEAVPTGVRRLGAGSTTSVRQASTARVAVLDTGIDLAHPDLTVPQSTDCTGTGSANDDNGHGTHVAGSIGARNNGAGVAGVAPGTRLAAVKVLDAAGNGSYSQIICGIDWVASTRKDADPANDVSVANLSLGGPGSPLAPCASTTDAMHRAICAATAAGVTIVAAAGNDGWDFDYAQAPDTPAVYPEVLTVTAASDSDGRGGAVGGAPGCRPNEFDDRAASFSNYATTAAAGAHAIAGPGVCITSDAPGGGTTVMSGTSMASPHVAGAVALCLGEAGAAGPCAGLTPAQIVAKMRSDAAARTTATPAYGFVGDPRTPVSDRIYGHLAAAPTVAAPPAPAPAPTVTGTSPTANKTAVPLTSPVTVTFSQPMNQAATQSAFTLVRNTTGAAVAGSFSWSGNTMTFKPSAALVAGGTYTATVGTGARNTAGTTMAAARTWTFRGLYTGRATPSSVTVSSGTYRSGTASSLAADDTAFYVVGSTTSGPAAGFYGTMTGADNDLTSLAFAYAGKNSATATQVLSFWNWTTSRWVAVDTRSIGTALVTVRGNAAGTLADYVSGTTGAGTIRFQVRSNRTTAFTTSGGRMALQFTR